MEITPYARQAQYYETDQMGIIHHANYIHWFEEARTDYLRQLGYAYDQVERDGDGVAFAVLGMNCEYRSMTRFGDTVLVHCAVTPPQGATFYCRYQVVDAATGALRATGESRHAVLTKDGRPVAFKKVLPQLYEIFSAPSISATSITE